MLPEAELHPGAIASLTPHTECQRDVQKVVVSDATSWHTAHRTVEQVRSFVMGRVRAILADEHRMVAYGIAELLPEEIAVVEIAVDGHELVRAAWHHTPDLIITAIRLPSLDGIEATRRLRQGRHPAKIILLSKHWDVAYARRGLRAGASAYVLKHAEPSELHKAITCALADELYVAPDLSAKMICSVFDEDAVTLEDAALRPRQHQVVQLLAEGRTNREIASLLTLSVRTVEFHKYEVMRKFDLHSLADLIHFAIRHKIVEVP